ncbi:hypothetical protein BpHYR1_032450, partial [Brachionus plicatilis]
EITKDTTSSYQKLTTDFNSKTQGVRKKGLESHTTVRKPLHNIKDRQKRYKWCKQRLNWAVNDFRVIFSGESNFEGNSTKSLVAKKVNTKLKPKPKWSPLLSIKKCFYTKSGYRFRLVIFQERIIFYFDSLTIEIKTIKNLNISNLKLFQHISALKKMYFGAWSKNISYLMLQHNRTMEYEYNIVQICTNELCKTSENDCIVFDQVFFDGVHLTERVPKKGQNKMLNKISYLKVKKNGTDRRQQTWNLKRPCKKGNLKLMINSRYHFNSKSTNTFEKNHKKSVYKFKF